MKSSSGTDFSQSQEQEIILNSAKNLPKGRFLDIGAGDGRTFSNTHALAEQGWSGVCVEPSPWMFDYLVKCYRERSDIECVNAVVTAKQSGLIDFYYARGDHLSSTRIEHTLAWPTVQFQRMTAAAVTLHDLLDYFGEPGFSVVSIDTEGTTLELLDAYRSHPAWEDVRCLCVEVEDSRQREEVDFVKEFTRRAETTNNVILSR